MLCLQTMTNLLKSTDPKDKILAAALAILNRHGYGALCLTAIANELGLSKQRINYHYIDPETIILQLAKKWSETGQFYTLNALANTNLSGSNKLIAIADGMFDWMEAEEELSKLGLVLYQLSHQIKKLNLFMNEARITGKSRIQSFLVLDEKFKKKSPKSMEKTVTSIHSHMYGHFFYVIAMNDFTHLQEHRENCRVGLHQLLSNQIEF